MGRKKRPMKTAAAGSRSGREPRPGGVGRFRDSRSMAISPSP